MKKSRLYNILFPMWLFYIIPTGVWMIILPANFLIDSLVLYIASKYLHIRDCASTWKSSILRIWGIGFASDFLGGLLILAIELIRCELYPDWNTFFFPEATLIAIPGVVLSAICIYCLDKRYAFVKTNLSEPAIKKLSMALAVFTAPYSMLIPLYG